VPNIWGLTKWYKINCNEALHLSKIYLEDMKHFCLQERFCLVLLLGCTGWKMEGSEPAEEAVDLAQVELETPAVWQCQCTGQGKWMGRKEKIWTGT